MALVLYTNAGNTNAFKALITARYSGSLGRVPVLETPDGAIFESNAIARYVANLKADNPLYGSSLIEYACIEQWMGFASAEIYAGLVRWLSALRMFPGIDNDPTKELTIVLLKRSLDALNTYLANNTYLVGHSVTLADIVMTCSLCRGYSRIMTKAFTSEFPHVERYFWTMVNQPNVKKVIGKVKQVKALPAVQSQRKAPAKEQAKPKEVKPKEVKKEAPPPKAAEAVEEEAPKPKPKNPLDLLPPSKMILDEWKRLYSNTKTNFREVAIKGFWDMYDPEGYSLWFCEYKYNEENTVSFVTMNKVGGFLQRMDLARKYAFGKMLVIGQNPPFKVKGLWLFRGQEIPRLVIDECYGMELYEWTKVDISDEVQKERVNAMIEDQEPFEGEPLLDARCFK
ncbi:Elongation factor 1-gamma [Rhynchospora pubera]|uniref:Elongation factor 1-gamma n=1 Tax=Rhynchospora pubera TaxID=906938 RepID=A0AAV8C1M8_9POAL|nr:Elongation factor 1-gamma [Rhynchospora pubera]